MSATSSSKGHIKTFYAKHPIISHLIIIAFAALVTGWLALVFLDLWTHHGSTATVPNVTLIDSQAAIRALEGDGFKVEISDSVYKPGVAPGKVISTWPRAGAVVKPGREVYLTIASYQTRRVTVDMPLVNVSSRQALNYLEESLNIKNVQIKHVPSQYPDLVVGATYDGQPIVPGMQLPVTAKVVLEVGVAPDPSTFNEDGDGEPNHTDGSDGAPAPEYPSSAVYE